eukprot:g21185.t1
MVQGLFAMAFGASLLTLLSEAQVFPRRCFCQSGPGAYGLCEAWQDCRTVISFLMGALASKQKLQAGESAEAEAGAEATRLLREARVEVNRLKAALQRQGHFDRIKEAESHRKAFEQDFQLRLNDEQLHSRTTNCISFFCELRTAREDAARKHEELQHLNQVQQEQLVKERDAERRLRLEAETRREAILLKLREMEAWHPQVDWVLADLSVEKLSGG